MNPINLVVLSAPTLFGSSQSRSLSCFYPVRRIARSSWSLGERLFLFTCIVTCVRQGGRLYSIVWLQFLILSPFHGASLSHSWPLRPSMSWSSVRRRPASAAWATITASKKSMPGAFVYNVLNLWSSAGVYRWNRIFSSSCRTLMLSPKPVWAAA